MCHSAFHEKDHPDPIFFPSGDTAQAFHSFPGAPLFSLITAFPRSLGFGRDLGEQEGLHGDLPHVLLSTISLKAKSTTHFPSRDLQRDLSLSLFLSCFFFLILAKETLLMGPSAKPNLKLYFFHLVLLRTA